MSIFSKNALSSFFGLSGEDYIEEEDYEFENFGSLLRTIRIEQEFTSSELAEKSSISQSYISQLENNVRLPSDSVIEKLAYALIGKDFSRLTDSEKESGTFYFSAESETKKFKEIVQYLKDARDYMKIKDIPGFRFDDGETSLSSDQRELLEGFSKLSSQSKQQLISYLNFLLNS